MGKRGWNRGLILRMVLAGLLTPLLVIAALVAVFALLPTGLAVGVGLALVIGIVLAVREYRKLPAGTPLQERDAPELFATVDRLCALADVPRPEIVLDAERQPNSWIVAPPAVTPRLHVTQGLLDLLDGDELRAVLAHEISHLVNHDAMVMTVVGMPGSLLLTGASRGASSGGFWVIQGGALIAGLIGLLSQAGTNTLSRCRELVADEGAAAITGHPSALASALLKVSGAIAQLPTADLRAAAGRDSFHLIAVETALEKMGPRPVVRNRLFRRLAATHPPLEVRLAALEQLEARLSGASR